jgi:hypothetical protein
MALRAFWTIVMEGRPTAFQSREREELLPTLKQLQSRHPDTHLMWYAAGRYWRSPEEAFAAHRASTGSRRGRPGDRARQGRPPARHSRQGPRAPRKGRAR